MITRSKNRKIKEIIQILSESNSVKQFKSDDSSCSCSSYSSWESKKEV